MGETHADVRIATLLGAGLPTPPKPTTEGLLFLLIALHNDEDDQPLGAIPRFEPDARVLADGLNTVRPFYHEGHEEHEGKEE